MNLLLFYKIHADSKYKWILLHIQCQLSISLFNLLITLSLLLGCKLRKLELKIAKNDEATIRLRREILLEEFNKNLTMTMTPESFTKVASFMPYLEKVYLDDVFNDNIFAEMLNKSRSDNLIDAWKMVSKSILDCSSLYFKLRCLSLPGKFPIFPILIQTSLFLPM